jgi:hypothetical protein
MRERERERGKLFIIHVASATILGYPRAFFESEFLLSVTHHYMHHVSCLKQESTVLYLGYTMSLLI